MAGASITYLRLDAETKALLDAPVQTPAITWGQTSAKALAAQDAIEALGKAMVALNIGVAAPVAKKANKAEATESAKAAVYDVVGKAVIGDKINTAGVVELVDKMADIIIAHEVEFCEADRLGDGDFGMSIAKGFRQLKKDWKTRKKGNIGEFLVSSSEIIMEYCGGASGPLWGSAFRYAGKAIGDVEEIGVAGLATIFQAAVKGIQETGRRSFGRGAVVGDKTLIDALVPAADSLSESAEKKVKLKEAVTLSAKAAVKGADSTKAFSAKMGRAGTVGDRSIGYPDAGAYGLGVIFTELAEYINKK